MANSREIRRRIKSVTSIGQMTRAMELVAAAKMRRAQDTALSGRRYNQTMYQILAKVLPNINPASHPLLQHDDFAATDQDTVLVIVFGPDRGLTGSLPTNLIRSVGHFLAKHSNAKLVTMGKRTRNGLIKLKAEVVADFPLVERPRLSDIVALANFVAQEFQAGHYTRVEIAKTHFHSTLRQEPTITRLLPLSPQILRSQIGGEQQAEVSPDQEEYLFEPNVDTLLNQLLPRFIEMTIYQSLLEAQASEYSAQMMAMKNAGDNAKDLQQELTLTYNQIRQASITAELAEIAAGAGS